ncbi:hypothetical protein M441DRAFT_248154 [Trichoderma asperellum CBS 433.97]|uniref:Uncharacterized protein n=1 Tax=Trichoderma asperellum (strain ATCC 204424 / CBS 433.97 / NBRC 101777) TaxID=1042311 RepID=A0A2T3Z043_TRIA4|nr:hypothetical protein M441DRAFT_248154 [Trichoderma asperellum CBS 433.97]PTB38186.1 hypothetical protein M441DRAFT_248154 [Trichoderma asperellum CBS 433.97]
MYKVQSRSACSTVLIRHIAHRAWFSHSHSRSPFRLDSYSAPQAILYSTRPFVWNRDFVAPPAALR